MRWLRGCGLRDCAAVRLLCCSASVRLYDCVAVWLNMAACVGVRLWGGCVAVCGCLDLGCVDLRLCRFASVGERLCWSAAVWIASVQWLRGCGRVAVKPVGSVNI